MKNNRNIIMTLAYISTILAILVGIYFIYIVITNIYSYAQTEEALLTQMKGGIGDLVAGTIGVFLSFASTLFLFVTFNEQRKQFNESKIDASKDRFESTFFNLLSMLYQVRENANNEISVCTDEKMQSLKEYYDGFKNYFFDQKETLEYKEIAEYLQQKEINTVEFEKTNDYLGGLYEKYIKEKRCNIGYYYRYIFNMINFVIGQWKETAYEKEYIHKYLNFIQAQMSNEELALIFYDVISHNGLDKNYTHQFKDKIDEYGFLENIDSETLLDRKHHILFPVTKFRFLNRDEKNEKTS